MSCKCYHADCNFLGKIGVCWGTKECEPCSCGGDEAKCNFYDYIRERAKKSTTNLEAQKVKGKWIRCETADYNWCCSVCGCGFTDFRHNYCYDCGAKMEE